MALVASEAVEPHGSIYTHTILIWAQFICW